MQECMCSLLYVRTSLRQSGRMYCSLLTMPWMWPLETVVFPLIKPFSVLEPINSPSHAKT